MGISRPVGRENISKKKKISQTILNTIFIEFIKRNYLGFTNILDVINNGIKYCHKL